MKNMGFMRRFVMFAAGTAQAGLRDDTLSAMLRCSAISDRSQRLACYDTAPPPVVCRKSRNPLSGHCAGQGPETIGE